MVRLAEGGPFQDHGLGFGDFGGSGLKGPREVIRNCRVAFDSECLSVCWSRYVMQVCLDERMHVCVCGRSGAALCSFVLSVQFYLSGRVLIV